jgi:hypothetical protein
MEIEPHKQRTLGRPRAEADLARLNRRFRAITRRQERARFRHRVYRALGWWVLAALCMASLLLGFAIHTGLPLPVALKHVAAAFNCDAASYVGLASASQGQPGYWTRNDTDGDGVSCNE